MKNIKCVGFVLVAVLSVLSTSALSSSRGMTEYYYFTQERNITEINVHIPAKKGLFNKRGEGEFRSTGNYATTRKAPENYVGIGVGLKYSRDNNRLYLYYGVQPPEINHRIPASGQIFREATAETYVYVVLPKNVFPVLENQEVYVSDHEGQKRDVDVMSPDETNLSNILEKYNSILGGDRGDYSSEMERALDGTLDLLGKPGKIMGWIMDMSTWVIEEGEDNRVRGFREKYGEEYEVYKVPFHVLDEINPKYINIGRKNILSFYSENPVDTKIFIEIPRLTFQLDVSGASRRASLEGLVYEGVIRPELITTMSREVIKPAMLISKDRKKASVLRSLKLSNVEGQLKIHKRYGEVYLVSGEIVGNNSREISELVFGIASNNYNPSLKMKQKLYIGPPGSEDSLLRMSKEQINKYFSQKVDPGKRLHFTVIFFDVPKDLTAKKVFHWLE